MSGLLNDVITGRHNDLAWVVSSSSDLSELSVNGLSGSSVEQEGSKRENDSFTMHVVVILYLIRHKISFPFSHLMTVRYKGYVTDLEEYIRSLTRDHILLRDREDILIWNFAPVCIYSEVRIYRPEWNGTRS